MILGNINDFYQNHVISKCSHIQKALEYLKLANFEGAENTIYLDEKTYLTLMELEAQEFDQNKFEAHKYHADIHYVVEGQEEIYISNVNSMTNCSEYKDDIYFGRCDEFTKIIMKPGDFCITFPEDAHRPSSGHGNILKKICVKIEVCK